LNSVQLQNAPVTAALRVLDDIEREIGATEKLTRVRKALRALGAIQAEYAALAADVATSAERFEAAHAAAKSAEYDVRVAEQRAAEALARAQSVPDLDLAEEVLNDLAVIGGRVQEA
jgi:hypothetical protein